ncbi:MAG TPA: protein-disulfide reductase DsbD domain-containing protein [Candidatus Eisenbacteria bacterium]|nr:protein-disulfide reductase DsbD domain-containing protein [Candidatus Eisenbacteria bacterium]
MTRHAPARSRPLCLLVGVAFASSLLPSSARASENVTVALLSETATVEPGRPFYVGVRMSMRTGWHTYWRNPGDAGLPPKIVWNLPEGFSAGPIEWPAPERFLDDGSMSYGYQGEVLLPIEIVPPARLAGDSATLAGTFEWLECADVCVPGSSELRLSLPVRPETPSPGKAAPSFAEARARMPAPSEGWAFRAEAGARAISLEFRAPRGAAPRGAYLFVDEPLVVDYAAPQGFEKTGDGYRLTAIPAANAQGTPERLTGVLVLEGRSGSTPRAAVRVDVPVARGDPAPAPDSPADSRPPVSWHIVLIAVAGFGLAALLARFALRRNRS